MATPEDQEVWVELAQTISGSQLIKICLGYRRAKEADSGERAEAQLARRGLWTFREDSVTFSGLSGGPMLGGQLSQGSRGRPVGLLCL